MTRSTVTGSPIQRPSASAIATRTATLGVFRPRSMLEIIGALTPELSASWASSPRVAPEREKLIFSGSGSRPEPPQCRHEAEGAGVAVACVSVPRLVSSGVESSAAVLAALMSLRIARIFPPR